MQRRQEPAGPRRGVQQVRRGAAWRDAAAVSAAPRGAVVAAAAPDVVSGAEHVTHAHHPRAGPLCVLR